MIGGKLSRQIEYNIEEAILSVEEIHMGYVNNVFLVHSSDNSYIVKIYVIADKKVDLSIAIQKYMSMQGMSPAIISEGDCGSRYVIQKYIDNKEISKNWFLFGQTLALLHIALNKFYEIEVQDFIFDEICMIEPKVLKKDVDDLMLLKSEIRKRIHIPYINDKQIIHGDYTWSNVLMINGMYQAIDYDEAKKYYKIYDIAKVIFNMELHRTSEFANAKKFLEGYQNIKSISRIERDEIINVYAYTIMSDYSGLEYKPNKNPLYIKHIIEKHRRAIRYLQCNEEIKQLWEF